MAEQLDLFPETLIKEPIAICSIIIKEGSSRVQLSATPGLSANRIYQVLLEARQALSAEIDDWPRKS